MLLPISDKSKTGLRKVRLLDLVLLEKLYNAGIVTRASLERANIVNDYYVMRSKFRRIELLYYKLGEIHNRSHYTIRNIVLTYERGK